MLNTQEINDWFERLHVSPDAQKFIELIRASEPSRRVKSGMSNVHGTYPSQKMGLSIQFESHTLEYAAIIQHYENNDDVLEYWDQPDKIPLTYKSKSGKVVAPFHTPDFLVIRQNSVGFEEWKMEEKLVKLVNESPNRYVWDGEKWSCPPGNEFVSQFGIYYKLRSSTEINSILVRNLQYISDFYNHEVPKSTEEAIISKIKAELSITLNDLIMKSDVLAEDVYALICHEKIYVDLYSDVLPNHEYVSLYCDRETALAYKNTKASINMDKITPSILDFSPGKEINWDGRAWVLLNVGEDNVAMLNKDTKITLNIPAPSFMNFIAEGKITGTNLDLSFSEIEEESKMQLLQASEKELAEANRRYEVVKLALNGIWDIAVPSRTLRSWVKNYRDAEEKWSDGYLGLLPQHSKKGNRTPRLPESTVTEMVNFIEDKYETLKKMTLGVAYAYLKKVLNDKKIIVPGKGTFELALKARDKYLQIMKQEGSKAAYKYKPFHWNLDQNTPKHGDRPFEIVHIDHTELEIELVDTKTGKNLGRPWLTTMVDGYSREFLAFYLTFDKPSYRSCMMVIRECVRRHSRFPDCIVVDGGKEFQSIYFDTLLNRYKCAKKVRPPAQSRFGSVCERLFGTIQSQFIHTLLGNTSVMRNVRQVTKQVNPKNNAIWTIPLFYEAFAEYAYEIYSQNRHSSLGQSPHDQFVLGVALSGKRLSRFVKYDYFFIIYTMPTTESGKAKVNQTNGIQIHHIRYSCTAFKNHMIIGTHVPVRYDPWDVSHAYAYINGIWTECFSNRYLEFKGRTEKEIQIACEQLRKRNANRGGQITEKRLAEHLAKNEGREEELRLQRARDTELRKALRVLQGSKSDSEEIGKRDYLISPKIIPDRSGNKTFEVITL